LLQQSFSIVKKLNTCLARQAATLRSNSLATQSFNLATRRTDAAGLIDDCPRMRGSARSKLSLTPEGTIAGGLIASTIAPQGRGNCCRSISVNVYSQTMEPVDDYIKRVGFLPPPPLVLSQLLSRLGKPNIDLSEVVQLISFDSALTSQLLKGANSAWVSPGTPIETVEQAVLRLGFNAISRIVVTIGLRCVLEPLRKTDATVLQEFWKHSVTTAVAGELLARDQDDDPALVFTAGLLHDIGKTVLVLGAGQTYKLLLGELEKSHSSLLEAEQKILGVQHPELGARLLENWNFPASLVAAIRFHHDPNQAGRHSKLAAYVYLANLISYFLGHGHGYQSLSFRQRTEALDLVGLSLPAFACYMARTEENFKLVQELMDMAFDAQPSLFGSESSLAEPSRLSRLGKERLVLSHS
jgi:putative nucleotidyltransferase with HDIG domain